MCASRIAPPVFFGLLQITQVNLVRVPFDDTRRVPKRSAPSLHLLDPPQELPRSEMVIPAGADDDAAGILALRIGGIPDQRADFDTEMAQRLHHQTVILSQLRILSQVANAIFFMIRLQLSWLSDSFKRRPTNTSGRRRRASLRPRRLPCANTQCRRSVPSPESPGH
jgi:hypothetical protein